VIATTSGLVVPDRPSRTGRPVRSFRSPRVRALAAALLFPLAGAWLAMLAGLIWWSNAPLLLGWHPRVVLTGSMAPALDPGDVVLMRDVKAAATLVPGRVIVVRDQGRRSGAYVHRIARRDELGRIVTKGDANQSEDNPAVTEDRVLGEVRLVVPAIGLPMIWLHQNVPALACVAFLTWAALTQVLHTSRSVRDDARAAARAAAVPPSDVEA
jgi:signal peptidase